MTNPKLFYFKTICIHFLILIIGIELISILNNIIPLETGFSLIIAVPFGILTGLSLVRKLTIGQ